MRKLFYLLSLLATAAVLAACSGSLVPEPSSGLADAGVASVVELTNADTREAVESRLGGSVVVWRPEAGFAIVRSAAAPTGLRAQGVTSEPNAGTLGFPVRPAGADAEVSAQAWKIWSGAWKIWSGAWKIWSGAWKIWSGGEGDSLDAAENQGAWEQIGLLEARDLGLAPLRGENVTIAVLDTGFDPDHPVFRNALVPAKHWWDFVDDDAEPYEVGEPASAETPAYGHGTAVSGIALQVAQNAAILPLRVLGPDGSGEVTDAAEAIDHAVENGAHVINLSFGAVATSPALLRMVEYAASQGVYVVSSSGNTGDQRVTSPASRSLDSRLGGRMSLGVGSVYSDEARRDVKVDHSTYGNRLELLAPGYDLYTAVPGERLIGMSGTSAAAAIVSGTLALGIAEAPDAPFLTEVLAENAANIDALNPEYAGKLGYGRIDVAAFLRALGD